MSQGEISPALPGGSRSEDGRLPRVSTSEVDGESGVNGDRSGSPHDKAPERVHSDQSLPSLHSSERRATATQRSITHSTESLSAQPQTNAASFKEDAPSHGNPWLSRSQSDDYDESFGKEGEVQMSFE